MADKIDQLWRGGVGEFIKAQRELVNLSLRQLAEIAKISPPYLSQVERGMCKPSADMLRSIAAALNISAETMYAKAGLLDEVVAPRGDAIPDFEQMVRFDSRLSPEQKKTLIRIYRGFVERV
jgi:transcriptional regulator with XRE-family HTH domain